jgi:hypothetical protein
MLEQTLSKNTMDVGPILKVLLFKDSLWGIVSEFKGIIYIFIAPSYIFTLMRSKSNFFNSKIKSVVCILNK